MFASNSSFTLYDFAAHTPTDLVNAITGNVTGIQIKPESIVFTAPSGSTSFFNSLDFGAIGTQTFRFDSPGILLTTGNGAPPATNTSDSYTVVHGAPGDPALNAIAQQAFSNAGFTTDAAVLEFSFTVTDPQVKGFGFDVMFGSEEYPHYVNSSYVDIAAITVNGENIAYIDGDPAKPLSIIGATVNDGRFFDNMVQFEYGFPSFDWSGIDLSGIDWSDPGALSNIDWDAYLGDNMGGQPPSALSIEYNGITPRLFVPVSITPGVTEYTVKIGIADTGDSALDSGLFVSNFRATGTGIDNPLVIVEAGNEGFVLEPTSPATPTYFMGGSGNDTMMGSLGADVFDLTQGGFNTILGTLEQLNQDLIVGFTSNDLIKLLDVFLTKDHLAITQGSAILDIDANGNGQSDATITLEGDFGGNFLVSVDELGTIISYDPGVGRPHHYDAAERVMEIYSSVWGSAPDAEGLDYWVTQIESGNQNYTEVVKSFFDDPLVQQRYEGVSGDEMLLALYQNIFRIPDPDEEGLAHWEGLIANDPSLLDANIGVLVMQMIDGMWDNEHILAKNAQSLFKNFVSTSSSFIQQLTNDGVTPYSQMSPGEQDTFRDAAREMTGNLSAGSTPIDMEGLVAQALMKISNAASPASIDAVQDFWLMTESYASNEVESGNSAPVSDELMDAGVTLVGAAMDEYAFA